MIAEVLGQRWGVGEWGKEVEVGGVGGYLGEAGSLYHCSQQNNSRQIIIFKKSLKLKRKTWNNFL